jgi:membrane fusion protein, copper/silver efflux system
MRRRFSKPLIVSAVVAAGVVGLAVGHSTGPLTGWPGGMPSAAAKQSSGSGKSDMAVRAGEDMNLGEKAPEGMATKGGEHRRIRFYRNAMGLPDTSPVPKKDSMGMDYLPVYEGDEQEDDSSVKVSAGKQQKAGVQTESVERRTLNTTVRAPGTVQEDERRRSVVSLRFEGFIAAVENVTTGTHVHKGQPPDAYLRPEFVERRR